MKYLVFSKNTKIVLRFVKYGHITMKEFLNTHAQEGTGNRWFYKPLTGNLEYSCTI